MSWNQYIDNLCTSEHVAKAAIIGVDGGVWAISDGLNLSQAEISNIVQGLKDADRIRGQGLHISGQKYFYLQSDDKQIQAKKGASGVSLAKSNQCIVIGLYGDGMQGGACRAAVERISDYLASVGY